MATLKTEDWERNIAFIRLDFPPGQRDTAQKLAVTFARVVCGEIAKLRPEHTIQEIVKCVGADSLDAREYIMSVLEDDGVEIGDAVFAGRWKD